MSLILPKGALRLLSGEPKTFTRACDSGGSLDCVFCPKCGTRIYHQGSFDESALSLKPGTLDDRTWLAPGLHIWTKSRQRWFRIPDGVRCFDAEPE